MTKDNQKYIKTKEFVEASQTELERLRIKNAYLKKLKVSWFEIIGNNSCF